MEVDEMEPVRQERVGGGIGATRSGHVVQLVIFIKKWRSHFSGG